ncbi:MAG: AzlC family ABC transporter permease [Rhizobiaceae bacterium]
MPQQQNSSSVYDWSWFARGAVNLFSLPALILLSAFISLGGLAREAGLSLGELLFMVPLIWALPSHLILVAGIVAQAPLPAIALAVGLASIRMMPMTMALVPVIKVEGSRSWHMLLASSLVSITAWVHTLAKAPNIPRRGRLPYFLGFAMTMMVVTTITSGIVYQLAATFPPLFMAGLYFLTPVYFACSIWKTSKVKAEYLALGLGFILGPIAALYFPQASILIGGVLGGCLAFLFHFVVSKPGKANVL